MCDSLFDPEWTFVTPRTRSGDAYNPEGSAITSVTKNSQGVTLNSMTDEDTRSEFNDLNAKNPADSSSSRVFPEIGMEESICVVETPANEEKSGSGLSKCAPSTSVDDVIPLVSTLELHQRVLRDVDTNTASGAINAFRHLNLLVGAEISNICIPEHSPIDEDDGSTTPRPNHAQSPGVFNAVSGTHEIEACKNARAEAQDSITNADTDSIGAKFRNRRTSRTSTMAASICAVGIAQSRPNIGSALHGNLPNTKVMAAFGDLHTNKNQKEHPFGEEIPQTSYPAGTPGFLAYLARIRLNPDLMNHLRLSPLRMLAAEVLGYLHSNRHRLLIASLLLFLPLLVHYISDYVKKVQQNRNVAI